MPPISIPNWQERFETAQSRKVDALGWIPFRRSFLASLRSQTDEIAMTMVEIVYLAATMPVRGVLNDGGRDLTINDISACIDKTSVLVAGALEGLGSASSHMEGRKEGNREGRKEGDPSSADADRVSLLSRIWKECRGRCPSFRAMSGKRKDGMSALVTLCEDREDLVRATVQAYEASEFHDGPGGPYPIDTLIRPSNRAKYVDKGHEWLGNGAARVEPDTPERRARCAELARKDPADLIYNAEDGSYRYDT